LISRKGRERKEKGLSKMNLFRLAGDMTHLLSVVVLLLKIHTIKSCAGAAASSSSFSSFPSRWDLGYDPGTGISWKFYPVGFRGPRAAAWRSIALEISISSRESRSRWRMRRCASARLRAIPSRRRKELVCIRNVQLILHPYEHLS
jgi:hypothetical protein